MVTGLSALSFSLSGLLSRISLDVDFSVDGNGVMADDGDGELGFPGREVWNCDRMKTCCIE
jgi:hypothetical protein